MTRVYNGLMTKYILNSGGIRKDDDKRLEYFKELVGHQEEPKVLVCLFAMPREEWEVKYPEYKAWVLEVAPSAEVLLAMPSKFEQQVEWSEGIYIHGGDDHLASYWLSKYELAKLFEGKTIAANSAGSISLSMHGWSADWRNCVDGMGLLPIKFIAHYKSDSYTSNDPRGPIDWEAAKDSLAAHGDADLPLHALEEGDYIVVET